MCEFFSCIITRDGRVLFTEDDSHETIIQRAGLRDDKLHDRDFVRIEVEDGDMEDYMEDEVSTLPEWYNENLAKKRVSSVLAKIKPLKDMYDTQVKPFIDAHNAQVAPIEDAYKKKVRSLWDVFVAQDNPLWAVYDTQIKPLRDAYNAQVFQLWNAYITQIKPFRDVYKCNLAKIEGYV